MTCPGSRSWFVPKTGLKPGHVRPWFWAPARPVPFLPRFPDDCLASATTGQQAVGQDHGQSSTCSAEKPYWVFFRQNEGGPDYRPHRPLQPRLSSERRLDGLQFLRERSSSLPSPTLPPSLECPPCATRHLLVPAKPSSLGSESPAQEATLNPPPYGIYHSGL